MSVIVASYNPGAHLEDCLQSLKNQTRQGFELIVVDSSTDGTAQDIAAKYPDVHLVRSERRLYPGNARNLGISIARGEIIAFVDADCVTRPDWVEQIVRAHNSYNRLAIGGAVENASTGSRVGWAAYFAEFSQWMPGIDTTSMPDIPTCCISYRREVFDRFGLFLEDTYSSDSALNYKLTQAGHPPLFVPEIRVAHYCIESLSKLLRKNLWHGRMFGRVRAHYESMSLIRRLSYAAGAPALPLLLLARIYNRVRQRNLYLREFWQASAVLFLALTCWSLGEAAGYLQGPVNTSKS